jgi:transposase
MLAHIPTNKYFFSLPLYLQEVLFKQKEIELARWMIACGNVVIPMVQEIKKYILSQNVSHCDEPLRKFSVELEKKLLKKLTCVFLPLV